MAFKISSFEYCTYIRDNLYPNILINGDRVFNKTEVIQIP